MDESTQKMTAEADNEEIKESSFESLPPETQQYIKELREENKAKRLKFKELEEQYNELMDIKSEYEKIKDAEKEKEKEQKLKAGKYQELLEQQTAELNEYKAKASEYAKIVKQYQEEKATEFQNELSKVSDESVRAEFEKLGLNSINALKAFNAKIAESDLTPASNFIEHGGKQFELQDDNLAVLWQKNPKAAAKKFAEDARKHFGNKI